MDNNCTLPSQNGVPEEYDQFVYMYYTSPQCGVIIRELGVYLVVIIYFYFLALVRKSSSSNYKNYLNMNFVRQPVIDHFNF